MSEWEESTVPLTQRDLMEQSSARGDSIAFLLIRSKLGRAHEVASAVSQFKIVGGEVDMVEWPDGQDLPGVRWAAELVSSPYDVIAAVRVGVFEELGAIVAEIEQLDSLKNPTVAKVVSDPYVGGQRVHQGWP